MTDTERLDFLEANKHPGWDGWTVEFEEDVITVTPCMMERFEGFTAPTLREAIDLAMKELKK